MLSGVLAHTRVQHAVSLTRHIRRNEEWPALSTNEELHFPGPAATLTVTRRDTDFFLNARTHEPHSVDVRRSMRRLHATHPGLAAWVLAELHARFATTGLPATPAWADQIIRTLYSTPEGRNETFRARHPEHPHPTVAFTERAIHHEGFITTASVRFAYGRWLCDAPWPPGATRPFALLAAGGPWIRELGQQLAAVKASALTAAPAPYPVVLLNLGEQDDDSVSGLTNDLTEQITHVYRYHDGTFSDLQTTSTVTARRQVTRWQEHQAQLAALLDHLSV